MYIFLFCNSFISFLLLLSFFLSSSFFSFLFPFSFFFFSTHKRSWLPPGSHCENKPEQSEQCHRKLLPGSCQEVAVGRQICYRPSGYDDGGQAQSCKRVGCKDQQMPRAWDAVCNGQGCVPASVLRAIGTCARQHKRQR